MLRLNWSRHWGRERRLSQRLGRRPGKRLDRRDITLRRPFVSRKIETLERRPRRGGIKRRGRRRRGRGWNRSEAFYQRLLPRGLLHRVLSRIIGSLFRSPQRRQLRGELRGPLFRRLGRQPRGLLCGPMLRLFGCALRGLLCRSLFRRVKCQLCSLLGRLMLCSFRRPLRGLLRRSLFRRLSCLLRGLDFSPMLRRARRCLMRCVVQGLLRVFFRCPLRGHLRRQNCRLPRNLLRLPLSLALYRGSALGLCCSLRFRHHRCLDGRAHPLTFRFGGFLHAQPRSLPDLRPRSGEISVLCAMQIRPGIKGCDVVRSSVLIALPFVIRHWTPFGLPALPISDLGSMRPGALEWKVFSAEILSARMLSEQ